MKTKVEQIEYAIKELRDASTKIMKVSLKNVFTDKFRLRQCKIVLELNAFVVALRRQVAPAKKREAKIVALNAAVEKLSKEVGTYQP